MVVGWGRAEQRSRLLPARVVVSFVLAGCLFCGQSDEEVAQRPAQGLERGRWWQRPWRVPAAAIARARRRLGPRPTAAADGCGGARCVTRSAAGSPPVAHLAHGWAALRERRGGQRYRAPTCRTGGCLVHSRHPPGGVSSGGSCRRACSW
ncbi:transposase domain-containing protein [Streptomyces sp. NPDC003016]